MKAETVDGLYDNLYTEDGKKDCGSKRLGSKDIGQMRTIKSAMREILMTDEEVTIGAMLHLAKVRREHRGRDRAAGERSRNDLACMRGNCLFYTAQYPVRWTLNALHH